MPVTRSPPSNVSKGTQLISRDLDPDRHAGRVTNPICPLLIKNLDPFLPQVCLITPCGTPLGPQTFYNYLCLASLFHLL